MRGIARYKQTDVQAADPGQIVLLLFREAVRRLVRVHDQLVAGARTGFHADLHHVREIVIELRDALDHRRAPALCGRLQALYGWSLIELIKAGREADATRVEAVRRVFESLLEGWQDALDQPRETLSEAP